MGKHDLMIDQESGDDESESGCDRMAVVDLMIERERRYDPKKEANRTPRRRRRSPSRSHDEDDDVAEMYKDYDLFLAAKNGHLDDFDRILDRVSTADSVESVDILSRLSLLETHFFM